MAAKFGLSPARTAVSLLPGRAKKPWNRLGRGSRRGPSLKSKSHRRNGHAAIPCGAPERVASNRRLKWQAYRFLAVQPLSRRFKRQSTQHDGDTIVVFEGVYEEDLIINKAVTIVGAQHGNEGTDGDRSPEFGFQETTIKGNCDITAAGAVTIDGIRFLNNGGGPSNPTLHIFSAADHVITNCIFYSEGAGAATDDRAISISPAATGEFTISDCYFTGASEGLFSDASWGRAIWFDGGGADLTVTGNTIEFSRTALNLDMSGTSEATIENNTLRSDGSGISVGFNSDGLSVSDNSFQNVGTDFNFRNLTTDTTFDAATAIGNLIPAVPANPGNDAVLILGGAGEDTLSEPAASTSSTATTSRLGSIQTPIRSRGAAETTFCLGAVEMTLRNTRGRSRRPT